MLRWVSVYVRGCVLGQSAMFAAVQNSPQPPQSSDSAAAPTVLTSIAETPGLGLISMKVVLGQWQNFPAATTSPLLGPIGLCFGAFFLLTHLHIRRCYQYPAHCVKRHLQTIRNLTNRVVLIHIVMDYRRSQVVFIPRRVFW